MVTIEGSASARCVEVRFAESVTEFPDGYD